MGAGVPAGAKSAYQGAWPKPLIVSPIVGTPGSAATRRSFTTPSTLSLPLLMKAMDEGRLCTDSGTSPPATSVAAAAEPL